MPYSDALLLAALRIVPGCGRRTVRKIAKGMSEGRISAEHLLGADEQLWLEKYLSEKQYKSLQNTFSEQLTYLNEYLERVREIRIIDTLSKEYPPLLRLSDDPPAVLFARGNTMDWHGANTVAVVGTRNMTEYGAFVTQKIAGELAGLGVVIVSGMMYGVDVAAHRAAVAGGGNSVAVLGYGLDCCYPAGFETELTDFKANGGVLLSEYPPWQPAVAGQFPARNTIVAGMSEAVVVTEAAEESGTMITVQSALDNGRHIFAVPGPIDNPYTSGTRFLINQGALLVCSGEEILAGLMGSL